MFGTCKVITSAMHWSFLPALHHGKGKGRAAKGSVQRERVPEGGAVPMPPCRAPAALSSQLGLAELGF